MTAKQLNGEDLRGVFEKVICLGEDQLKEDATGKYVSGRTASLFESFLLGCICVNEGALDSSQITE